MGFQNEDSDFALRLKPKGTLMNNALIVSGHTDLNNSVANRTILQTLSAKLPDAVVDRLDALYPDFDIDVPAEQAKLEAADVIVLQFPVFWYAMPSLMQKWMEDVFVHGWSHGGSGTALKGKKLVVSCTAGAPEELYAHEGPMGHTIEELFLSSFATADLTGMEVAGMVFTGGVSYQMRSEGSDAIEQKAIAHADRVVALVESLEN